MKLYFVGLAFAAIMIFGSMNIVRIDEINHLSSLKRQAYAQTLALCREEFTSGKKVKIHGPEQDKTAMQLEESCRKIAKGGE